MCIRDSWTHFHQFIRVQIEDTQEWLFFRYWDPRVTPVYFDSIKALPETVMQWSKLSDKQRLDKIIINIKERDALTLTPKWEQLLTDVE